MNGAVVLLIEHWWMAQSSLVVIGVGITREKF